MIFIATWAIILFTLIRYAPLLIQSINDGIEAIRERNPAAGRDVADRLLMIGAKVAIELSQTHGLTKAQKTDRGWQMVRDLAANEGLTIGENESREYAEHGLGHAKRKGWIRGQ